MKRFSGKKSKKAGFCSRINQGIMNGFRKLLNVCAHLNPTKVVLAVALTGAKSASGETSQNTELLSESSQTASNTELLSESSQTTSNTELFPESSQTASSQTTSSLTTYSETASSLNFTDTRDISYPFCLSMPHFGTDCRLAHQNDFTISQEGFLEAIRVTFFTLNVYYPFANNINKTMSLICENLANSDGLMNILNVANLKTIFPQVLNNIPFNSIVNNSSMNSFGNDFTKQVMCSLNDTFLYTRYFMLKIGGLSPNYANKIWNILLNQCSDNQYPEPIWNPPDNADPLYPYDVFGGFFVLALICFGGFCWMAKRRRQEIHVISNSSIYNWGLVSTLIAYQRAKGLKEITGFFGTSLIQLYPKIAAYAGFTVDDDQKTDLVKFSKTKEYKKLLKLPDAKIKEGGTLNSDGSGSDSLRSDGLSSDGSDIVGSDKNESKQSIDNGSNLTEINVDRFIEYNSTGTETKSDSKEANAELRFARSACSIEMETARSVSSSEMRSSRSESNSEMDLPDDNVEFEIEDDNLNDDPKFVTFHH